MVVASGNSVYVFVSYGGNALMSIHVSGVTDSVGSTYHLAGKVQNGSPPDSPCQEIWYADNVAPTPSLSVTVTFNTSTFFEFTAVQIAGTDPSGSLDAVSAGAKST
ncbi:MAG TPA: hypothetical protein VMH90_00435, partial [Thermoplasmata archaeon]|nr:hypothetical protein [Thermoplasmata archaeon]